MRGLPSCIWGREHLALHNITFEIGEVAPNPLTSHKKFTIPPFLLPICTPQSTWSQSFCMSLTSHNLEYTAYLNLPAFPATCGLGDAVRGNPAKLLQKLAESPYKVLAPLVKENSSEILVKTWRPNADHMYMILLLPWPTNCHEWAS